MSLFRVSRAGRGVGVLLAFALVAVGLPDAASAQEARGTLSGRVTDPSGAALPGVAVTATNAATNVSSTTTTNEVGDYHLLYLPSGRYTVTAELSGFKKRSESNIEIRVGDKVGLPIKLELGQQTETVEVVSEAPLLETGTASAGQVVGAEQLALMPLADGNPFVLARLAPGIVYNDSLQFSRPFDNNASSGLRVDGGSGRNEFSLDGAPNTVNFGGSAELGRVAFVPPSDAVQEFKIETASFDAQHGHSGGGNLNVSIKSGTNRFSGSAYMFYRDEALESDTFFNEKRGDKKAPKSYNRYGATLGGPIQSDKTFFFAAFEGIKDEFPEPTFRSVPTMAQREGDFSALLSQGIILYNPLSARRGADGVVVRDPFPGNIIPPGMISPAAREIMSYYPEPNAPGDANGLENYFTNNPRADDFYSITTRVDHTFSQKNKVFVRFAKNSREETRNYFFPEVKGIVPIGTGLRRMNDNGVADFVSTLNHSSMLNVRVGWTRFREQNFRPHEGYDPASLGFSSSTLSLFGGAKYLPTIDLDRYDDLGNALGSDTKSDIFTVQSTLTRVMGAHSFRAGIDLRSYQVTADEPNNKAGSYQFRNTFTSARQGASAPTVGGDLVMLLLGIPTGGSIDRRSGRENQTLYGGIFFQDDWRVTERLTVNLGLRYDMESGMTEAQNRNVRGFDLASTNPLEASVRTEYAKNPVPERPVSQFNLTGGYTFASDSERNIWKADKNNIQPRVGFTYKLDEKTVVRGGGGVYYSPFVISNVDQTGFSQATNIPTSPDQGLTFPSRMSDPFPLGVLDPIGSSLGLVTNVGRGAPPQAIEVRPLERENARVVRFLLGFQRELPGSVMFEANYVGNRSSDIETEININAVPRQYLSTSPIRDQATIDYLEGGGVNSFPNPFRGNTLIPATENLRTATVLPRSRFLRPYPQFQDMDARFYDGSSAYNALQLRADKRFKRGFTVMASYTLSKLTEKVRRLNATDTEYEDRLHADDSRHRWTGSVIWQLPFARDTTGAARQLLHGWNLTTAFTIQTGRPINLNDHDRYFAGDLKDLKIDWDLGKYDPATQRVAGLFPTQGFYFDDKLTDADKRNDPRINRSSHIRTFPTRIDGLRTQTRPIVDASIVKQFDLRGRMKAQLRVEMFNVLNFVELNTPGLDPRAAAFGSSNAQTNLPRELQLGLKITF